MRIIPAALDPCPPGQPQPPGDPLGWRVFAYACVFGLIALFCWVATVEGLEAAREEARALGQLDTDR